MEEILLRVKMCVPANGTMLNDLNDLIIKYMEENGIDCYSVDSKINFKTGE